MHARESDEWKYAENRLGGREAGVVEIRAARCRLATDLRSFFLLLLFILDCD